MQVTIDGAPAYAVAYCHLEHGETVNIESGGMALMSDGIDVSFGTGGGVAKGIMRKAFGGESFLMGTYRASVHGAWVAAAPRYPGDVRALNLKESGSLICQTGSLLAFDDKVDVSVTTAGIGAAIATRGLTLLRISGYGTAVISSYGAISEFNVGEGQSIVVDTGHLIGFTEGMDTETGFLGGLITGSATGESLVMRLNGPGVVYIQTRAESGLKSWLNPLREQNER